MRHGVRAFAEEVHERGRPGRVVDRGVDRRPFGTQDGEIGADAPPGTVDHRRFRDAAVDALEAVLLDRDHVTVGESRPAACVFAPRSVHDAPSRDESKVEQKFEEPVVPVFLLLFNGGERLGDAVPHVHRSLLAVRKVLRPQHVGGEVVILVIVAAIEREIVHRFRTLDGVHGVPCVHGGKGGSFLVGHRADPRIRKNKKKALPPG